MALIISNVAKDLYNKICSRFPSVAVNDRNAVETLDPTEARFFNFDYVDKDGTNFGNVTISIANELELKITYGMNITAELTTQQKAEWFDFLKDMRMFAKRNLLGFSPRDISKDRTSATDIKKMSVDEVPGGIAESKLYGTTKTSYESIAPGVKLSIKHSAPINADVKGARTRKIHTVYIEDAEGQRFKSPTNHLLCCRALGMHVANGGYIGDEFGKHVTEMSSEMAKLKTFIRGAHSKVFENDEANEMTEAASNRFIELKKKLGSISKNRGYKKYICQWSPAEVEDNVDLDEVKSKFIINTFDSRLEEALPYVYAAYKKVKENMSLQSQIDEFSQCVEQLSEVTTSSPLSDAKIKELTDIMSEPFMSGEADGLDAGARLQSIFANTNIDISDLMDSIYEVSNINNEVDIRPIIFDWLLENVPDVGEKLQQTVEHLPTSSSDDADLDLEDDVAVDDEEPVDQLTTADSEYAESDESDDDLEDIKRLSGIKQ